jgi:hypothetical protein
MNRKAHSIPQIVAILALALTVGCASSSKKASPVNVQALSEHTVAMVGELVFDLRRTRSIYLTEFVYDGSSPAEQQYEEAWQELEVVMKTIVAYSMGLVNLSIAPPAEGASQVLADDLQALIEVIYSRSLIQQVASDFPYDDVVQLVRDQETFSDGLIQSQPAVDELARTMTQMIAQVRELAELARDEIEAEIRLEHRGTLTFRRTISRRLDTILAGLASIEQARSGDTDGWTALFASDREITRRMGAEVKPTTKNLDNAEEIFLNRLRVIDLVRQRTEPSYETFLTQRRELIDIEPDVMNALRRAQISVIVWSRVHRQFATGKSGGGFSFGSLSALLIGYAL